MKKIEGEPARGRATQERPDPACDPRPAYEPPRIMKKRSVARATLASQSPVTGTGPSAGGLVATG
jgi:hypothetical protein